MENNIDSQKNQENFDVLELMMNYELILKDLYFLFSQKIPTEKDFWKKLSEEENKHAYWLEVLGMNMKKENISLNEDNRFNLALIKTSLDHVREATEDFNGMEVSLFDALSFASDVENSMIEKKFFEVFYGQSEEFDRVMKLLKEETIKHGKRIQDKLEEERKLNFDDREENPVLSKIRNFFK